MGKGGGAEGGREEWGRGGRRECDGMSVFLFFFLSTVGAIPQRRICFDNCMNCNTEGRRCGGLLGGGWEEGGRGEGEGGVGWRREEGVGWHECCFLLATVEAFLRDGNTLLA